MMALPVTDHPTHQQHVRLLSGLEALYRQQVLNDVTLLVGHHKLPCHRLVLAASSPYFR